MNNVLILCDETSVFNVADDICHFLRYFTIAWPATLLKKRFRLRCFLVNFAKFLRTPFL